MNLSIVVGAVLVMSVGSVVTNEVRTAGSAVSSAITSEEKEYQALTAADDAAQAEVDKWRRENRAAAARGAAMRPAELDRRIRARLKPVQQAYLDFLRRHPKHVRARLSYGCFLDSLQDEAGAQAQWEKVLELDPNNADAYNNLAERYSEVGPAKKAFEFFEKAIALKPSNGLYYHNFADAIYVLRRAAMAHYGLSEQQVFSKTLDLYRTAARLEPHNFAFGWDFAETYYALRPFPYEPALRAWTNALASAQSEGDREAVYVHLARVKMLAGRLAEARAQLDAVTNETPAKAALLRTIQERQKAR